MSQLFSQISSFAFRLLENIYTLTKPAGRLNNWPTTPQITKRGPQNECWFCFVPYVSSKFFSGIMPKTGTIFMYNLPTVFTYSSSKDIGKSNPILMRNFLRKISQDAYKRISKLKRKKINFLGVSLGNIIQFHIIGKHKPHITRMVAVAPVADLPWCVLHSVATQKAVNEARKNGLNIKQASRAALDEFSPIKYISVISPQTQLYTYIGGRDRYIPTEDGERLIKALKRKGKNVKVKRYRSAGHFEVMWRFSTSWQKDLKN